MFLRHFRSMAWRLGRKLYCWARNDLSNNPETNGEYWLLKQLTLAMPGQALLVDVGANKGEWSLRALSEAKLATKQISVNAFEPCAATRSMLNERLTEFGNVEVFAFALSATDGEADFFSNAAGAGTNSLNAVSGSMSERVQLITLDSFVEHHDVNHIAMLKIDTEGFDFGVLQGAQGMLRDAKIDVVQFEYNWRWLLNKASLLDVFALIKDMPYRLGKLSDGSIEFYDEWHFELDRFFENNYVLVRKGFSLERLGQTVYFDASNCPVAVVKTQ